MQTGSSAKQRLPERLKAATGSANVLRPFRFLCFIFALLLLPLGAFAQVNTGNLSGLVTDPTGAVVRNATITVTSGSTGYTRIVQSGTDGAYIFPDLPIGGYMVTVSATGFSTLKETATINVGAHLRRDFHVKVGEASDTVEVVGPGSGLSRDDASISTVITSDIIASTPLFLRNWDDLLRTVPGVQINRVYKSKRRYLCGSHRRLQRQRCAHLAEQLHSRWHRQQHLL